MEDRRAKHHGKGKSLDRKAHGHGHKAHVLKKRVLLPMA